MSRKSDIHPVAWVAIGASAVAAVILARQASKSPQRRQQVLGNLHQGLDKAREVGEGLLREGREQVHSLQGDARSLQSTVASNVIPNHDIQKQQTPISNHESAVAAFMATLLAKGFSSYLHWRQVERAKARARINTASDSGSLDELTVTQLRRKAAEREIEGRSSMNKQDLVSALEE